MVKDCSDSISISMVGRRTKEIQMVLMIREGLQNLPGRLDPGVWFRVA